ncbi:MAG TPA: hypothetical protein PK079_15975 [Leptospiraceae bacterium]|nr:hypothetical protein [Leptospiraceae bacterium]HMW08291.1 hypothetical protein [Leptospiraceae bacterium]HMX33128.1 hypothetical protein [Leptospiraceae bacterium]HMY34009.1 hypothetical protein [Leptospiraceae bacterium]HMZ63077.1 hypothetical protein [Leptospiraceae bacterium]
MFTSEIKNITGIHTEILTYRSTSNIQILILPGNPGIGSLYIDLGKILYEKFNGQLNLYLISYAGFTKKKSEKKYTLKEELDHKINLIQELKKEWHPDSKVLIVGHSIGAWLAKEIYKELGNTMNISLYMLFPFLAKSDNPMQVNFSKFLANPNHTGMSINAYKLITKLPASIFLSLAKLLYSHASENTFQLITDYFLLENHIIENIFYLANNEFETLTEDFDLEFFQAYPKNINLYYCPDDMWAPLSQIETIKQNTKEVNAEILNTHTHDFCVSLYQCEIIAEKIRTSLI